MSLVQRLSHLAIWRPALRVLCYHRVLPDASDRYTVTTAMFDAQLRDLRGAGYAFVRMSDLLAGRPLPRNPLLVTFDDGYIDNLEYAQPVMKKHGVPATLFVATGHAGQAASWGGSDSRLMSADELKALDSGVFELAMHSHGHRSFATMTLAEIQEDLESSMWFFAEHKIAYLRVLAYPYGARPRADMAGLSRLLTELGIPLAFRIGNRINRLPLTNRHEVQRLDVRGDRSAAQIRRSIAWGRL